MSFFPPEDRNHQLHLQAQDLFPGGVNSPVRGFRSVGGIPPTLVRGRGAWVQDAGGKWYLDLVQSWGAHILGHNPPEAVRALRRQSRRAASFGAPSDQEVRLGHLIRQALPSVERLRLTTSGTEAVMSALRLARAATNRDLVLKFDGGYHGHADSLLVNAGSGAASPNSQASSAGVPASVAALTLSVPYNDLEAVRRALAHHPGRIAAVIVEPVAANMGLVLPAPGFLPGLRDLTREAGSLLIFDEVITGFRLGLSGAQGRFGITPDLTTLGKIIGGGLPCGAYGGRKDLMDLVAPSGPVYQAGTLAGNPLACAAGAAVLERLTQPDFYTGLEDRAQVFFQALEPRIAGLPVTLNRLGTLFTLFFTPGPVTDFAGALTQDGGAFARFFHTLLAQGIWWPPAPFEAAFLGAAHGKREYKKLLEALPQALESTLKKDTKRGPHAG